VGETLEWDLLEDASARDENPDPAPVSRGVRHGVRDGTIVRDVHDQPGSPGDVWCL
jgi:hypothetical protein